MINFLNNKVMPIGLDIGSYSVKMLQLSNSSGNVSAVAAARGLTEGCSFKDSAEFDTKVISKAIKDTYQRGRFKGNDVVCALPAEFLSIKNLRIDSELCNSGDYKIHEEVAQRFSIDRSRYYIDYLNAGQIKISDQVKNELIIFYVLKDRVQSCIDVLEMADLNPVGIEVMPCAMFRCFLSSFRREADKAEVNAFADIGFRYTTVVIGNNTDITLMKQFPIGGERFDSDVAARLDISTEEAHLLRRRVSDRNSDDIEPSTRQSVYDAMRNAVEELVHEISLCFRYHSVTFRGRKPNKFMVAGGEAKDSMLIQTLSNELEASVELASPFRSIDVGENILKTTDSIVTPEWSVAVGLGLKRYSSQLEGSAK